MLDSIPDHDGRSDDALAAAFERIDADRRLYLFDGDRRILRAAAAWDAGSAVGVHRELTLAVEDIRRARSRAPIAGDRAAAEAHAAWKAGEAAQVYDRLARAVTQVAARLGIERDEMRRLLLGPQGFVLDEARRIVERREGH